MSNSLQIINLIVEIWFLPTSGENSESPLTACKHDLLIDRWVPYSNFQPYLLESENYNFRLQLCTRILMIYMHIIHCPEGDISILSCLHEHKTMLVLLAQNLVLFCLISDPTAEAADCIRLIHAPGINRGIACTRLFIQHIKLLTYDEMSFLVLNCSLHCRSRKIVRSMVFSISVCSSSNNNISMEDLIIIILKAYLNGSAYCSSPWLK